MAVLEQERAFPNCCLKAHCCLKQTAVLHCYDYLEPRAQTQTRWKTSPDRKYSKFEEKQVCMLVGDEQQLEEGVGVFY